MSCWRKYTCNALKNVDPKMLEEVLGTLGITLDHSVHSIGTSWYGGREANQATVSAGFVFHGKAIPIGIKLDTPDHILQIEGDFWGTGLDEKTFVSELGSLYLKTTIKAQLELNGWTVDTVDNTDENEIVLEAICS